MSGRRIAAALTLILATGPAHAASTAGSSPYFTVTDLGASFHLQQDAIGWTHGVTNGDGSQVYAFEKSPVWYNPTPFSLGQFNENEDQRTLFYDSGKSQDFEVVATNGSHLIGYWSIPASWYSGAEFTHSILDVSHGYNWAAFSQSPVKDLNASGESVGIVWPTATNIPDSFFNGQTPGHAGFTGLDGTIHPFYNANNPNLCGDDLNGYISKQLGITLTVGLKVDDLGRIIAEGTTAGGQTHDFLLTPDGVPILAPEPTTLALFGLVATAIGLRAVRRRA